MNHSRKILLEIGIKDKKCVKLVKGDFNYKIIND